MKLLRALVVAAAALATAAAVQLATSSPAGATPGTPDCLVCWERVIP